MYECIVIHHHTEFHVPNDLLLLNKKLSGDMSWLDIVFFYKKIYLNKCCLLFIYLFILISWTIITLYLINLHSGVYNIDMRNLKSNMVGWYVVPSFMKVCPIFRVVRKHIQYTDTINLPTYNIKSLYMHFCLLRENAWWLLQTLLGIVCKTSYVHHYLGSR